MAETLPSAVEAGAVVLVEARTAGHHARYLQEFARSVERTGLFGSIRLHVSDAVAEGLPGDLITRDTGVETDTISVDVDLSKRDWRGVRAGFAELGLLRDAVASNPDGLVVALYGNRLLLLASVLFGRRRRRRTALVLHQGVMAKRYRSRYGRLRLVGLRLAARRGFAAVGCVDETLADELARRRVPAVHLPLSLEAIGADTDLESPPPPAPDRDRPIRVLVFGALSERKGLVPLLEAVERQEPGAIQVNLLGELHEPQELGPVRQAIRRMHSDRICFSEGRYTDAELAGELMNCDVVYAGNSGGDGDSAVFWQALAAGRPVIVSRSAEATANLVETLGLGVSTDIEGSALAAVLASIDSQLEQISANVEANRQTVLAMRSRAACDRAIAAFLSTRWAAT